MGDGGIVNRFAERRDGAYGEKDSFEAVCRLRSDEGKKGNDESPENTGG